MEKSISLDTLKREHGFFMLRSTDQGKTWSPKYSVPVNNVHGPVLLDDGSLFFAGRGYSGNFIDEDTFSDDIVFMRSTDNGLTWNLVGKIPAGNYNGYNTKMMHELHCIQASDGTIVTHIRDCVGSNTLQTVSHDGGKTWSEVRKLWYGHPDHLLRMKDGRLLSTYGFRVQKPEGGVRCRISSDNGETWSDELVLFRGADNGDMGYPSTVQLSDGSLFSLWYQWFDAKGYAVLAWERWELAE